MNSLHIELTSRCVLECPGCPRTWFKETFNRPVPKLDLDTELFEQFLNCNGGQQITHFHLESNHGDCIYYPQLIEFVQRWRESKTFTIVTNGSRRTKDFWQKLNELLTPQDQIIFSIDGLEHNNHMYRVNSDWASLQDAVEICTQGPARVIWKTIVFAYNQHELNQIKQYATDAGADQVIFVNTHRYGNDQLMPEQKYIDTSMLYKNLDPARAITPKCGSHSKETFVTPEGYCWPCCWISSYYTLHKTDLWKSRDRFNMKYYNLDQIRDHIEQYAASLTPGTAHSVCSLTCGA